MGDFPFLIPFRFYQSLFFCSRKNMDPLTLECHNSFQNENNRKDIHTFASRPLIFKLQEEVLKTNEICVSWSSPKTDLDTNLLNLQNLNFLRQYLVTKSPLKMTKNAFCFTLKAFCLNFLTKKKSGWIRKIRLISKFMTSQLGKLTIAQCLET